MNDKSDIFKYNDMEVRIVRDGQNEPWWVVKDIAEALGHVWKTNLINHVPKKWRGITSVVTP